MQSWTKIKETVAYSGWRKILHKHFLMPDGQEMRFDIVGNNPFVTIAALTNDLEFILVKQFRPGPEEFLLSFPEGYIDENEAPERSAIRELSEETGYQANEIHFLKKMRSAYSTETRYSFLATGCTKMTEQKLDPAEYIEVELMPIATFRKFLKNPVAPVFTNIGSAYLALEHLNLL